jgi:RNA polymerase sigma-70 factor, ECF subfamily
MTEPGADAPNYVSVSADVTPEGHAEETKDRAPTDATARHRLQDLMIAVGRGDQHAFSQLYGPTKSKMFGVALAIVRRRELAEEVLQDAYTRIWQNAGRFDPLMSSPVTWMVAIVRHRAIDVLRRLKSEFELDECLLVNLVADDRSPLDQIQLTQDGSQALAALLELPPLQRQLIIAAYIHGESRAQLAVKFGSPANTIKTWLRRALLEMRTAMKDGERLVIERDIMKKAATSIAKDPT